MKKHINLWLVMFLAISLALPIYSMAQTNPNPTLTLESYTTGDRISGAPIKSFALGADGNLVVYLDGPFNFASLVPDITVDGTTYSGCTVSPPASVSATQGATLIFRINSTTPGASFSGGLESKPGLVVDPEPGAATSFAITTATGSNTATGIFTWTTGGGTAPVPVGAYLAVFQAQVTDTSGTHTSHLIVMININPPGYTLTINATNGSVTKSPDQATYTTSPIQTVTLTAVPASGYSFTGWSGGGLSGSTTSTNVVMDSSKTVTASFAVIPPQTYSLALYVSGPGAVGKNPDKGSYSAGESVQLTATPSSGATFTGWSGDLTGSTNPTTITMGSNKTITATFAQSSTPPPTGNYPKLNQPAAGSGDFYGATISIAAGEVRTYILPLGEVYPNQNLKRLLVKSAALIDGTGQVSVKLTSPDTPPWINSGSSSTADFTLNAIAQSYPMGVNYPATYLNNGYWILQITGVQASQLKLWWKCY